MRPRKWHLVHANGKDWTYEELDSLLDDPGCVPWRLPQHPRTPLRGIRIDEGCKVYLIDELGDLYPVTAKEDQDMFAVWDGLGPSELTNIFDIVEDWLRQHGYEGLCNLGCDCGCGVGYIMPCGCPDLGDCRPAYEVRCGKCDEAGTCKKYAELLGELGCTPDDRPEHLYARHRYLCGHDDKPNDLVSGYGLQ